MTKVGIILSMVFIITAGVIGFAVKPVQISSCVNEDGSGSSLPCFWDASASGNGQGRSFVITADGTVHYNPIGDGK